MRISTRPSLAATSKVDLSVLFTAIKVLRFNKKNRFYQAPQSVTYGESAISSSGRNIVWTGKPMFFDLARNIAVSKAKGVFISEVQLALKR